MQPNRRFEITDKRSGAAINVRVYAGASAAEIADVDTSDQIIHVRLTSLEPGGHEANEELRTFLAQALGVEPNKIDVVAGENGRDKILAVEGLNADQIDAALNVR